MGNPDELKDFSAISLSPVTVIKALPAIGEIMKDTNPKECWEETDDFQAWKFEVEDLRALLESNL